MEARERCSWVLSLALAVLLLRSASRQPELRWRSAPLRAGFSGSCICSRDTTCICTPNLSVDVIMEYDDGRIGLVRRRDNGKLATMGGFVEVGESVESACARELLEETGMRLAGELRLLGVFSDPARDPRRHTASAAFVARVGGSRPKAADDVKAVEAFTVEELSALSREAFAFAHADIVRRYLMTRAP